MGPRRRPTETAARVGTSDVPTFNPGARGGGAEDGPFRHPGILSAWRRVQESGGSRSIVPKDHRSEQRTLCGSWPEDSRDLAVGGPSRSAPCGEVLSMWETFAVAAARVAVGALVEPRHPWERETWLSSMGAHPPPGGTARRRGPARDPRHDLRRGPAHRLRAGTHPACQGRRMLRHPCPVGLRPAQSQAPQPPGRRPG
jgi:hypothetical protein